MDIQLNEGSGMRELLDRLLQALTPLAQGTYGTEEKKISSFSQRLFIPPPSSLNIPQPFRHAVRILDTLQKQMGKWIERFPSDEEGESSSVQKSSPRAPLEEVPLEDKAASSKQNETPSKPTTPLFSTPREVPQSPISKPPRESSSTPMQKPVQVQAKALIVQVRQAIEQLSIPSHLSDSKQVTTTRELVKKLKPLIDDLIEVVGKTEKQVMNSNTHSFQEKTPLSIRQQPAPNKEIPLPFQQPKRTSVEERLIPTEARRGEEVVSPKPKEEETHRVTPQVKPRPPTQITETKESGFKEAKPAQKPPSTIQGGGLPLPRDIRPKPAEKREATNPSVHFDRIVLPGAPYLHQTSSTNPPKPKKRKKSLWEKESQEDKERDSSSY